MNPTKEQIIALETIANGNNLKLNAFAGAGKTSTLIMMAEKLSHKQGIYLAFNKGIAQEAQRKMPRNVVARTFHSMAYSAMPPWMAERFREREMHINEFCRSFKVNNINYRAEVDTYYKSDEDSRSSIISMQQSKKISSYKVKRLIDLSLNKFMASTDREPSNSHAYSAIQADLPELKKENLGVFEQLVLFITPIIQILWRDYSNPEGRMAIGNNHSVYFKYWTLTNPVINYDFILFDEAQDADPLMLEVLEKQKAQIIYVGDKHQQIYAWRGAVNALDRISANELYLTQSFRFGQVLADQCKPILDALGETQTFKGSDVDTMVDKTEINNFSQYTYLDACLCRTNAEVVLTILELAMSNVPCNTNIDTGSIVKTLWDMEELQLNTKDVDLSLPNVPIYVTSNKKLNFHSWEEFIIYMEDFNTDPELAITFNIYINFGLKEIINALEIAADMGGVTVTTAHKAKGLEWDRIVLKSDFLKGFFETRNDDITYKAIGDCAIYDKEKWTELGIDAKTVVPIIRTDENVFAELRLLYVAITRAKLYVNIEMLDLIFSRFFLLHRVLGDWTKKGHTDAANIVKQ